MRYEIAIMQKKVAMARYKLRNKGKLRETKSQLLDINSAKTGLCDDIFKNAQKHTFEKNNQSGKFCTRIICKMSLCSHMSTSRN